MTNRYVTRTKYLALRLAAKLQDPSTAVLGRATLHQGSGSRGLPEGWCARDPEATHRRLEQLLNTTLTRGQARAVLTEIQMTRRLVRQGGVVVWRTLDDEQLCLAARQYMARQQ